MLSAILLWLAVMLLFVAGLFGTLIPLLPGIPLILAGVLLYALVSGFSTISGTTVAIISAFAIAAWLADYYAGALGAKAAGGGNKSALGATLGAIVGFLILLGPLGLLIGAFSGALIGAALEGKSPAQANKIALTSLLATVGAALVQLVIGLAIIIAFFIAVFF